MPRGDLITRLAWAGVIGRAGVPAGRGDRLADAPQMLVLTALAGFVGGFVILVARMPQDRDDDDDDGAVV